MSGLTYARIERAQRTRVLLSARSAFGVSRTFVVSAAFLFGFSHRIRRFRPCADQCVLRREWRRGVH